VSYDPLADVSIGSDDEVRQILSIGEAIVMSDGDKESHWTDSARMIFVGIIEAVLHTEKNTANHTLAFCRSVYQRGLSEYVPDEDGNTKETAFDYLRDAPRTAGGLALDAFTLLEDAGEEESGSFSTTLARQLQFLSDPRMQRHLKNTGFSLTKAVQENWSVYVCLPPSQIARMKRWMRALVRVGFDAKMFPKKPHEGIKSLFLIDEFFSLGKMSEIEESAAFMAGYGIKLVPVIQNIGRSKSCMPKIGKPSFQTRAPLSHGV
jgi:type IV secretion system protein VirD4